jgi:hypothetical protein
MRAVIAMYLEQLNATQLYGSALKAVDRIFSRFLFTSVMNLEQRKAAGETPRARLRLTVAEYDERVEAEWQQRGGC